MLLSVFCTRRTLTISIIIILGVLLSIISNTPSSIRSILTRHTFYLQSILQIRISLFLYSLGVLQLLNQFHFQHLHLHNLLLLLLNHIFFFTNSFINFLFSLSLLPPVKFLFLEQRYPLLLLNHLVLSLILLRDLVEHIVLSLPVLNSHNLCLFGFFLLT